MPIRLTQRALISEGDIDVFSIDGTDYLDAGEVFTGTPTAVEQTTGDLTISDMSVNAASVVIDGATVEIGAAIQGKVLGQLAATRSYDILVTATTDATLARTVKFLISFDVQ